MVDAVVNRLYGSRWNPLYQSGTLAVVSLLVLLVTGIYLLLFYRVGAPWESVAGLMEQEWSGRWIRTLHRYASDVAVAAALVHGLRMLLQGRSWGRRALAWTSGLVLVGVFLVCGWTGYVMVWDRHAQLLAVEGARLLDVLPIFSEPLGRTFVGERALPGAFFFLNLFLHIALPIGVALLLWIHVARVARPVLLPPRGLTWGAVGVLTVVSVVWAAPLDPPADLFRVPGEVTLDLFYTFFLPVTRELPAGWVWALGAATVLAPFAVPLLTRPREEARPEPSRVDERLCTGCEQCVLDCPWDAIAMVPREGDEGRSGRVARVDPEVCVSCGICAGSCAPMGVGPPRRTGRDQLAEVKRFIDEREPAGDVVVVACDRGSGGVAGRPSCEGAPVLPVGCAGSLHTSVVEYLVRAGAAGVLVASCPPRDCWNREGPAWLEARMYEDREAELQERVDRRRVRLVYAGPGERGRVEDALSDFRAELGAYEGGTAEEAIELETECEVPEADEAREVTVEVKG